MDFFEDINVLFSCWFYDLFLSKDKKNGVYYYKYSAQKRFIKFEDLEKLEKEVYFIINLFSKIC